MLPKNYFMKTYGKIRKMKKSTLFQNLNLHTQRKVFKYFVGIAITLRPYQTSS